jgi:hypothetical protein
MVDGQEEINSCAARSSARLLRNRRGGRADARRVEPQVNGMNQSYRINRIASGRIDRMQKCIATSSQMIFSILLILPRAILLILFLFLSKLQSGRLPSIENLISGEEKATTHKSTGGKKLC